MASKQLNADEVKKLRKEELIEFAKEVGIKIKSSESKAKIREKITMKLVAEEVWPREALKDFEICTQKNYSEETVIKIRQMELETEIKL